MPDVQETCISDRPQFPGSREEVEQQLVRWVTQVVASHTRLAFSLERLRSAYIQLSAGIPVADTDSVLLQVQAALAEAARCTNIAALLPHSHSVVTSTGVREGTS
jgi:hypothetical protein